MMMEIPRILEDTWTHARPGREAAERNELLRALVPPAPTVRTPTPMR
jgi:hypothetical protein